MKPRERVRKRIRLRSGPSALPNSERDSFDGESRSAKTGFRPDIEGLRAVAVLAVVLFHAGLPGVGGGFIGVDVFFVISGFLITGMLWREVSTAGTVRLRRFYGARARRLLPASAAVGVVTMVASVVLLLPLQARDVIGDGIASALYVGNIWFVVQATDYFSNDEIPSPFQHYWSLGVEEQFYLVWPALIIVRLGSSGLRGGAAGARTALEASIPRGPYLGRGGVICRVAGAHPHVAACGVLLDAHSGLAISRRRLGGSHGQPVAPNTSTPRSDRGMGRFDIDPADLQPVRHDDALSGYRRAAACARHGTGDRRGLRRAFPGSRSRADIAADAGGRAGVVFVVSVALAGAGARSAIVGPPAGTGRKTGNGSHFRRVGRIHMRFIENPLRFAPSVSRSAARSLALGGAATAVAACVGMVLLVVDTARSAAARRLQHRPSVVAHPPTGDNMDVYDAAVQHAFAQVQAAVAASAALNAVPVESQPAACRCGK